MDAFEIVGFVDAYAEFLEEIVHAQHRARLQLRVLLEKHHRRSFADAGRCLEPIEAVRKSFVGARWVLLAEQRLRHRARGSSTLLRRRRHRQMDANQGPALIAPGRGLG